MSRNLRSRGTAPPLEKGERITTIENTPVKEENPMEMDQPHGESSTSAATRLQLNAQNQAQQIGQNPVMNTVEQKTGVTPLDPAEIDQTDDEWIRKEIARLEAQKQVVQLKTRLFQFQVEKKRGFFIKISTLFEPHDQKLTYVQTIT